jgi:hypothetical protein
MPLPLADFNKRPVVFVDVLSPALGDLYRAFDVLFVMTSNVTKRRSREAMASILAAAKFPLVARHLHADWTTPYVTDSDLGEEVDAWHAAVNDRTPTTYLIVTSTERGASLGHILKNYSVAVSGPDYYIEACRILHSQLSFEPFNPDWY